MRLQLLGVERDAHRQALDHLDPVAGRVLRRDQRERRSGAAREADDAAVIFDVAAIEVGGERHRLADLHAVELPFLEVGVDVELVERHDQHQRRTRGDALSDLDVAARDDAVDRRADHGALQVELGLGELGLGGQHFRRGRGRGAPDQRVVRRKLAGRLTAGRARLGDAGTRQFQVRTGGGEGVGRAAQFFARDGAIGRQPLATLQVEPRALIVGLCGHQLGAGTGDVGVPRFHLRSKRGARGRRLAILPLRPRQIRLGLRDGDARIAVVEADQHRALAYRLGVRNRDARDLGRDHRRDARGIGADIGVVGAHIVAGDQQVIGAEDHRCDQHQYGDDPQQLLAPAVGLGALACGSLVGKGGVSHGSGPCVRSWPRCWWKSRRRARGRAGRRARRPATPGRRPRCGSAAPGLRR